MTIVCVGDCGVDRYVDAGVDRPGGIVLNVAVHARRLFRPADVVQVVTVLGTDPAAELVARTIESAGLDGSVRRLEGATPVQWIGLQPSGEKQFLRYDAGVLGDFRVNDDERGIIARSDILFTTVFAQAAGLFESVIASPSPGLRVVDFTDLADVPAPLAFVDQVADAFHIGFFGLRATQRDLITGLERVARERGRLFVVTLAEHGSLALGGLERVVCPATAVQSVVDTTGAGDTFAAAFLSEYCHSRDVARSLARGSVEAAETIQRVGAFELEP